MRKQQKKELAEILSTLQEIKGILLKQEPKPKSQPQKVQIETRTTTHLQLYRSADVAKKLGLTKDQFDSLRSQSKKAPHSGGKGVGNPALWTDDQIRGFQDFIRSGQYRSRNRTRNSLLTPDQAARFLGIGKNSFARLIERGEIPYKVIGKANSKAVHRRFRRSDLEAWMNKPERLWTS